MQNNSAQIVQTSILPMDNNQNSSTSVGVGSFGVSCRKTQVDGNVNFDNYAKDHNQDNINKRPKVMENKEKKVEDEYAFEDEHNVDENEEDDYESETTLKVDKINNATVLREKKHADLAPEYAANLAQTLAQISKEFEEEDGSSNGNKVKDYQIEDTTLEYDCKYRILETDDRNPDDNSAGEQANAEKNTQNVIVLGLGQF